jgi:predicted alpha/beta hydrolase family esterase
MRDRSGYHCAHPGHDCCDAESGRRISGDQLRGGSGMRNGRARLRVIVLHGAHGGPDTNWFPWLHAALAAEGIEVLHPRFPTPQGQSLDAWFNAYDLAVESLPPAPTFLVGHSLGAAFALRLVERAAEPFDGLFLAAGFIGALGLADYDSINQSFFAGSFDWVGIRERKGHAGRCWAGDNDPYVPLSRSQDVADWLKTPLEIVPGGGHLNDETGFDAFPQLRDAILAERA